MDLLQVFLYLGWLLTLVTGIQDKELYCSVCRVLIDEISWSISQVDPKKKIQVGSFRVDPNGNQARFEVPYARSESHLIEVFEHVCERMNDYAQTTNVDGHRNIVRTSSRNGKPLSLRNISINRDIQKKLKFYCDTVMEEHEEEITTLFKENMPEIEKHICGEIAAACTESELSVPLATLTAEEEGESFIEDGGKDEEDEDEDEDLTDGEKDEL